MVVYYAICVFEPGFLFLGITLFRCDKILNCDMIFRPPARPRPQMQRKTKDQLHTALGNRQEIDKNTPFFWSFGICFLRESAWSFVNV